MPGMSDNVDVGKLPQPEIVAKHLSPIVSSQRYEADGYVTESVGPDHFERSGGGGRFTCDFLRKVRQD